MKAKIEKTSELSKLLSVKTRMSDDLFHLFASLASVTCYLVFHWRNMTGFRLRKQLVNLSTRWLVHLPCYSVFYLPYLQATCWLVYWLTCPLPMLLCLLFTLSTSNWFTRLLVDLSTCLLFNKKTSQPCIFNKFCYICKLFNTYVSHVCWDYRYFILWV